MKKIILYILTTQLLLISVIFGQESLSYKEDFYTLFNKKDTSGQQKLLKNWEQKDSEDAELYIAYFNYFASLSKKEMLTLGNNPKNSDALEILSSDTSTKKTVGFLYSNDYYDKTLLEKGFEWINKGIEKHPNRLDMRFGKIFMYGQIEDYESFSNEIITTVAFSKINNNTWTWTDN